MNSRFFSTLLIFLVAVHQASGFSVKPLSKLNPLKKLSSRKAKTSLANHEQSHSAVTPLQSASSTAVTSGEVPTSDSVGLYAKYLNWIDESPLIAKSVTAAVVGCIGDIMAQWLEAYMAKIPFVLKLTRFFAFFVSGLLFVGPFLTTWYEQLWAFGRYLENNVTKNKTLQTLAQVALDQSLGVILFFPTYFYAYEMAEALVSFRAPAWSVATEKLLGNLGPVFFTQYKVWPFVNFFSFSFVPMRMRVLFNNIICIFWNAFLCTQLA